MTNSTNLNLPYILPNQAQKHVTHNEALKMLDVFVQLSVVDNSLSAPPQTPSEGDSYTVFSSPTGEWANHQNKIAIWHDGAWSFYPPNKGWVTWVESNNSLQAYNGTDWVDISGVLSAGTTSQLGINASADAINRLSVNSAAILFNKEIDDVQVKLNKQATSDNASFLFQTNFSGRAEIGTTGDDDFHFKVSSDGATWNDGILINKSTGEVSFPNTTITGSGSAGAKGDKGDKGDTGDMGAVGHSGAIGPKGDKGDQGDTGSVDLNKLVARIFTRKSPTQWGFCHVASDACTDLAKTTQAVAVDDVVAVIADKSPNNIDLIAGGTDVANKIKLRLDPVTVGVDESHLTSHFLKVTVPTGGFKGKLIMAYRSGCFVSDVDVLAGDWEIWSGHGLGIKSGFIGVFAAENISNFEIDEMVRAFHDMGAGSKPTSASSQWLFDADDYYRILDLRKFDFTNLSNIGSLFKEGAVRKVFLAGNDLSSVTNAYSMIRNCSSLITVDTSNWDISSVTNAGYMFSGCSSLTALIVSDWDVSSITNAGYMFNGCASLAELDVRNWNISSMTAVYSMFRGCSSLKTLDVSDWDTSSVTDPSFMFYGCSSLTPINVSDWDTASMTNLYNTFRECSSMTTIDVSDWDTSSVTNMSKMFFGCGALSSIDISNWDTSSLTNASLIFYGCKSLTTIIVGGAFDNTPCTNFTNAFYNCAFGQQSVDDILVSIEKAGTSNGTLNMTGTNNSAPSSSGVTAKTALVSRGWAVTTN